MRGKPTASNMADMSARIIPAHAGQTRAIPVRLASSTDHPRACGANFSARRTRGIIRGSSPRMRGKRRLKGSANHRPRIIPAHAGQTCGVGDYFVAFSDHPRACGANSMAYCASSGVNGSSPRMRGKLANCPIIGSPLRIIPAHAGQTAASGRSSRATPDHPRACGANRNACHALSRSFGSSPRMRGKLLEW